MRILIIGFGNVGQNLAILLSEGRERIATEYGSDITVVGIADRRTMETSQEGVDIEECIKRKREKGIVGRKKRKSLKEIIEETEPDVVVELTTSNTNGEPGFSNIVTSLSLGKSVVTTNKGPIARGFHALLELASRNGARIRFSGTVGGGTPFLDFGYSCSLADEIESIRGILNSTTNYILTMMEEKELNMNDAIREAVKLGIAEENPKQDIMGIDTALKLTILSNFLLKRRVSLNEIEITGIEEISKESVLKARRRGKKLKLVAYAGKEYFVKPVEIDENDPFCVDWTLNSLEINCKHSGSKLLIGKGAGGKETATAVLRDLIYISKEVSVGY